MAAIKSDDVGHMAKLSQLRLTTSEIKKFSLQLSTIVEHISVLDEVNTDGIEPTSQTTGLINITRADLSQENCLTQEEATSQTKKFYHGYFEVPVILEKDTVE